MKKILCTTVIAAFMSGAVTQAETVVYQSDFTGADLASAGLESAGASGGIWDIDTVNDRLNANLPGGNDRATVKNTGSWQSDDGFTLDVTFNQLATATRFTIGLADASATWNQANDFLNSEDVYSIAFTSNGEMVGTGTHLLGFSDGTTDSKLSDAQGDITFDTNTTLSITITPTGYSYSLNGAPATTGSVTFDTSKSYKFVAFGQNPAGGDLGGSYISNVTLTALTDPVVPYEGTVWELDMDTDPVLTNWTDRTGSSNYMLTNGVMTMNNSTLLDTEPVNALKGVTKVDMDWRSITEGTGIGRGAYLWLNIDGDEPEYYPIRFESILTNGLQTVQVVASADVTAHTGFSTNMLTLSATVNALSETADYIVTDGILSVTNSVSLVAKPGAANYAATLGTQGPSAEVDYVRVEANARPDDAYLVASDAIAMELLGPATLATGSVDLVYGTASNDLEITSIAVSDESHGVGSFNVLSTYPDTLASTWDGTSTLEVEFDNSVAGLVVNASSATGLVTVTWTETGTGVTNDTVVPVSATLTSTYLEAVQLEFSQVFQSSDSDVSSTADQAVDDNTSTFSLTDNLPTSYWQAELDRPFELDRIEIVNRLSPDDAEMDGLTLTLFNIDDQVVYEKMHRWGDKRDYFSRLDAPDRALKGGLRTIGIGALLGLADPVYDILCVYRHANTC